MIFCRHSVPRIEPEVSAHEWELSEEGRELASVLAEDLGGMGIDRVFSSPEPKARETGAIVARALEVDLYEVDTLGEHERGGVEFFEDEEEFRERVREALRRPEEVVFGEETVEEARFRFSAGLLEVIWSQCRRPLIVGHGTVLAAYLAGEFEVDPVELWEELEMPCWIDREACSVGDVPVRWIG